jgi:hypothetical protein
VVNNPCGLTDQLGFDACNFNIAINNSGLISNSQLKTLKATLKGVFDRAGVGVNFDFSGPADYSLDVTTSAAAAAINPGTSPVLPPTDAGGLTPGLAPNVLANYGYAFVDRLITAGYGSPTTLPVSLAYTGALEAGHYLIHIGDSPQNTGIMAPQLFGKYWRKDFSDANATLLKNQCNNLHPPKSKLKPTKAQPAGPSGIGRLDEFDLLYLELGGWNEDVTSTISF